MSWTCSIQVKWSRENVPRLFRRFSFFGLSRFASSSTGLENVGKLHQTKNEAATTWTATERCNTICLHFFRYSCRCHFASGRIEQEGVSGVRRKKKCSTQHEVHVERTSLTAPMHGSQISGANKITETDLQWCEMHNGFELTCSIHLDAFFSVLPKITFRCCDINHSVLSTDLARFDWVFRFGFVRCARRGKREMERKKPNYMRHWLWRWDCSRVECKCLGQEDDAPTGPSINRVLNHFIRQIIFWKIN